MGYWMKLYTDILDDEKVICNLSDTAQLGMFFVFLVAKKYDSAEVGNIQSLAFRSRKPVEFWEKTLPELIKEKIVADKDGIYSVTNYDKRQAKIDSAERSRQSRASANAYMQRQCNADVTKMQHNSEKRHGEKRREEKEKETEKIDRVALFDPLLNHFSQYSAIPMPVNKNGVTFMAGWLEPIDEILEMAELDVGWAKDLITKAIDKATGKFTISSPRSLIKTIAGIIAEEKRMNKKSIGAEFKADEFLAGQNDG